MRNHSVPRSVTTLLAVGMAGILSIGGVSAQDSTSQADAPSDAGIIHILPVQGNVYMLVGDGANITAQVGEDGVLLVDSGTAPLSDKVIDTVKALSKKPIRYIINTNADADHVGGNAKIAPLGKTVAGGNVVGNIGESAGDQATVIASQSVLDRMDTPEAKRAAYPESGWPSDTYSVPEKDFYFNGEAVQIFHVANAHTDGDSMVFFRRSDVVSAGDVFMTTTYPVIDLAHGGSVQGVLAGLNQIIWHLTIPKDKEEGGTMVIPGHGRLSDQADVEIYREMVTIVRDRVQDMINKGMTLEQVQAAKPTRDYDARYGATTGPWTTQMFVEAVYKSLTQKQTAAHS